MHGAIVGKNGGQPLTIIKRGTDDFDIAIAEFFEAIEIGFDVFIKKLPFGTVVGGRNSLDRVFGGMRHDAVDFGFGGFGDDFLFARFEIDGLQNAGIVSTTVDEIEDVASFIEAG